MAFLFSWIGCLYDTSIWIFLWFKRSRAFAYLCVIIFHILTAILFPRIGMFPYIMITATLIFFSSEWHERLLKLLNVNLKRGGELVSEASFKLNKNFITGVLVAYFIMQLFLPIRHLQYPGNLFWHEQGYRFSWRVMLMEKNGLTNIILNDPVKNERKEVNQNLYLTPFQKQQMRSQPDMLIQFANHLGEEFLKKNGYAPEVYIKSRISLNGRRSQVFTNDTMNVLGVDKPLESGFILPFKASLR